MKLIISEIQFNKILSEQNYSQVSQNFKDLFKYKFRIDNELIIKILISSLLNMLKKHPNFKLSNLNQNTNNYARNLLFDNDIIEQIKYIRDYLISIDKNTLLNYSNKFREMNLIDLYKISDNWHKSLESEKGEKEFGDKIIIDYRKNGVGYYWIYTEVHESCEKESNLMGHCGSSYSGYHISLHSQDINGKIDGHITIDMDLEKGENRQTFGKGNSTNLEKYYDYIEDLYEKFNLNPFRCQRHLVKTFLKHGYLIKKLSTGDFVSYLDDNTLYDILETLKDPRPIINNLLSNDSYVKKLDSDIISVFVGYFDFDEVIDKIMSSQSFVDNINSRTLRYILQNGDDEKIENYVEKFLSSKKFMSNITTDKITYLLYFSNETEKIMNKLLSDPYFLKTLGWYIMSILLDFNKEKRHIIINKLISYDTFPMIIDSDIIHTVNYYVNRSQSLRNEMMSNEIYVKYFAPHLMKQVNELKLYNMLKTLMCEKSRRQ